MAKLTIFPDENAMFDAAARTFVESAARAIDERGRFAVALAGGSTPRGLYARLAGQTFRSRVDWPRVFFFFGDERFVPADDLESNFRMANETLFNPLSVDAANIVRWRTEIGEPSAAAQDYAAKLSTFFDDDFPVFDLVFLGLGTDGHTASLFPESPALDVTSKPAVENFVPSLGAWRLTLTFPVIEAARQVIFLVTGNSKAKMLELVLNGDSKFGEIPAQRVRDRENVSFLADASAVSSER